MQKFKPAKLFDAGGDLTQRWFIYYYFRSPETGKFRRFRDWVPSKILTGSGRREKAHHMIKNINKKLNQGFNPYAQLEKKYNLLTVAIQYVLTVKVHSCRLRTHHTYSSMCKQFNDWLAYKRYELMTVDEFDYYHAQEFMDYTKTNLKNSNRSYNNRVTGMKTFFRVLVKREWIISNPFDNVEHLPVDQPEIIAFTIDELTLMQTYLPAWNFDLYVCACLIFYCFIRPQEIVRLKVANFQLSKRSIVIPGKASKNKKQEVVQVPDALMPVMMKLNLNYPGDYFVFGKNQQRGPVEYAPTRIAEAWRAFAEHYGINKKIYSLKHTGVGMAIENGINIRDLQLQLRHSSLEMTQIYLDKFNRRPSEKLSTNFPDLSKLSNSGLIHLSLPANIYKPGLS